MSPATRPGTDPFDELEGELRHVRDLVFLRDVFARRGATPAELGDFAIVIEEARMRLAGTAKATSKLYAAAA